ncbi:MAG: hypothetical protein WD802_03815 [Gemmatimonadaceae bacterium]|mgnify:CR=1 FL=1
MFVAVQHNISNPEAFWTRAKEIVPNLPSHLKLHQCFPNKTGSRGICIWEGDSVKAVQTYLDGQVGHVSSNDYYEVENMEAIALPTGIVPSIRPSRPFETERPMRREDRPEPRA